MLLRPTSGNGGLQAETMPQVDEFSSKQHQKGSGYFVIAPKRAKWNWWIKKKKRQFLLPLPLICLTCIFSGTDF